MGSVNLLSLREDVKRVDSARNTTQFTPALEVLAARHAAAIEQLGRQITDRTQALWEQPFRTLEIYESEKRANDSFRAVMNELNPIVQPYARIWNGLRDRSPRLETGFARLFSAIDKVSDSVSKAETLTKIANRQVFAQEALKSSLGDLISNLKVSYSAAQGCPEAGDSFELQFISTEKLTARAALQRFLANPEDPRSQAMLRTVVDAHTVCLDVSKSSMRLSVDGELNVAVVKQDRHRRWEAQFDATASVGATQMGYLTPAQARLERITKLRSPDATGIGYRFEACDRAVGTRRSRQTINARDICEAYWDANIRPTSGLSLEEGFVFDDAEVAGPSSFRVEPNSQNRWSSSSPVGMWAGCL